LPSTSICVRIGVPGTAWVFWVFVVTGLVVSVVVVVVDVVVWSEVVDVVVWSEVVDGVTVSHGTTEFVVPDGVSRSSRTSSSGRTDRKRAGASVPPRWEACRHAPSHESIAMPSPAGTISWPAAVRTAERKRFPAHVPARHGALVDLSIDQSSGPS
jgi:hypothetical protein